MLRDMVTVGWSGRYDTFSARHTSGVRSHVILPIRPPALPGCSHPQTVGLLLSYACQYYSEYVVLELLGYLIWCL